MEIRRKVVRRQFCRKRCRKATTTPYGGAKRTEDGTGFTNGNIGWGTPEGRGNGQKSSSREAVCNRACVPQTSRWTTKPSPSVRLFVRTLCSRANRIGLNDDSCLLRSPFASFSLDWFLLPIARVLAEPTLILFILLEQ